MICLKVMAFKGFIWQSVISPLGVVSKLFLFLAEDFHLLLSIPNIVMGCAGANPYLLSYRDVSSCFGSGEVIDSIYSFTSSWQQEDEGSESMIHLCTCTRGSASAFEYPNHQEQTNSCKSCGGKLAVDGRGALSGNMLSTVGLELSRVIDPHLNWKTASKGRQRAVRRARTSFPGGNRKKTTTRSLKESENATEKESKRTGDIPVSESEKLGVSILGRRFSDALESVPIKKRRFLLVRSPSPPPEQSSHSDESDHMVETHCASYQETVSSVKQHRERTSADDKTCLKNTNEELSDVDFSGISILAAAACDSDIVGDVNSEGLVSRGHACKANDLLGTSMSVESHSLSEVTKKQLLHTNEDLHGKSEIHLETSSILKFSGKGSDGIKLDESHDAENLTGSLKNFPEKTGTKMASSRDSRFHWDLNTVMDAWESNCDEAMNSEPLAPDVAGENGIHNEKLEKSATYEGQMDCEDAKHAPEPVDAIIQLGDIPKDDYALPDTWVKGSPGIAEDSSDVDHDKGKEYCSPPPVDGLVQEEHLLDDASVAVVDSAEETKRLHNQKNSSCTVEISSPLAGDVMMGPLGDPMVAAVLQKEKDDACFVEAETSSSQLAPSENVICGQATPASESHPEMGQLINKTALEEDRNPASLAYLDNCSAECCLTDARVGQATLISSSQVEKHGCFHHGSERGNTDQCPSVSLLAEKTSDLLVDEKICANVINAGDLPCKLVSNGGVGETECHHTDEPSDCLSNSHTLDRQGSTYHDGFSSISTAAGAYETTAAELKMDDDDKVLVVSDVNLGAATKIGNSHIIPKTSDCNSAGAIPAVIDVPPLDCAESSYEASKCRVGGCVSSHAEAALDHFDCHYDADASQNDADRAIGMEKVDLLEDDDSQYEDGEFRECLLNTWGEDGTEEGETEHVDYGSDNRENDMFDAASDYHPVSLQVDNVSCKNGGLANGSDDGAESGNKYARDASSQPLFKCSSKADVGNAGSGKRSKGSVANKVQKGQSKNSERDMKDPPEFGAGSNKVNGESKFLKEGDDIKELSHSARMKSSGWDRLPEHRKIAGHGLMDSGASPIDSSGTRESFRRVGSSLKGILSSRIERPKSSDGSHRNDKSYVRASRCDDHNGLDSKAERDTGAQRSVRRGGSSRHAQGRGRGDHWADSPSHCSLSRHESPGYYGPASFVHPGTRNAAAAAVAKVESNGFVVAPDGTIVKAAGVGPANRLPRRSTNAPLQSTHRSLPTRGSPIERDRPYGMQRGLGHSRESADKHVGIGWGRVGRYGPELVRERYRRPMHDDCMDSSMSMQHSVSRRERSFSPRRGPLHLSRSRTRSPSRSRTRSPHMWTSPRGRSDVGMNGGPGLLRRSRSPPNFKTEARMERTRSPHRRPGFEDHMVGYIPASRKHASPPHSSRWVDDRKESPEYPRENDYKRRRVFSRTDRCDLRDSPGKMKPDEYYLSMYSSRFSGFVGFGRGARHDESGDDIRGHGERYGMLHSIKQYEIDGNVERLRYDAEDGIRAHNSAPKSSEFRRRGSPRGFDRAIESHLEDSPQRAS